MTFRLVRGDRGRVTAICAVCGATSGVGGSDRDASVWTRRHVCRPAKGER